MGEPAPTPQPASKPIPSGRPNDDRSRFVSRPPSPLKRYYDLREKLTLEVSARCEQELEKILAGKRITEGDKLVLIACLRGIMCVNNPGQALKCLQQYHELRDEILDRLDVRDHGMRVREKERREAEQREAERSKLPSAALM